MTYGLWSANNGASLTFTGLDAYEDYRRQGIIERDATLVWTVEANTDDEAMSLYHQYMGWEPYKPLPAQE